MEIKLMQVTVGELFSGYENNDEDGVRGYGGRLNIWPKYQREFIYSPKQQQAVIISVRRGFPLNVMYWAANEDGTFELLDGQQRTMSLCSYLSDEFMVSHNGKLQGASNLTPTERQAILDYKLMVYVCDGTDEEKLEWFQIINIAGVQLKAQEIRNAVYAGPWVTAAKRKFSKTGCLAQKVGGDYLSGSCLRQDYLETVIGWISAGDIKGYMAAHQRDANADELWQYFQSVCTWVALKFPKKRAVMKSVPWGVLYNKFKDAPLDAGALEIEVARLMQDSDVKKQSGIYEYVLDGDVRHLDIRAFDGNTKRRVYERQKGICPLCGNHFELSEMEADHITPWKEGGHTEEANCQMLCRDCNRRKGAK